MNGDNSKMMALPYQKISLQRVGSGTKKLHRKNRAALCVTVRASLVGVSCSTGVLYWKNRFSGDFDFVQDCPASSLPLSFATRLTLAGPARCSISLCLMGPRTVEQRQDGFSPAGRNSKKIITRDDKRTTHHATKEDDYAN
jgi:hypothetical protein